MISIPVRIYVYYKAIQLKMDKPKDIGKRLDDYRKSIPMDILQYFHVFKVH